MGVVAGDEVLDPGDLVRLDRLAESDRVRHGPAGAAVERDRELVAGASRIASTHATVCFSPLAVSSPAFKCDGPVRGSP